MYIFVTNQIAHKLANVSCFTVIIILMSRYKRGTRNCSARHAVLAELDKPVKGVPSSGIVKVSFKGYAS